MLSFMLIISFVFWIISVSLCFYLCLFNYSSIFHNQYFVIPKWLFIKPNTFYIRWNTAMYLSLNECDDVDLCSFEKWLKNHDSFRISTGTIANNRDYFYSFIWFVFFYITFFLFLFIPCSSYEFQAHYSWTTWGRGAGLHLQLLRCLSKNLL